jgi:predicted nucleic acid-binding protein
MPFLLDTNILSELRKGPRCDSQVANWAARESGAAHYISVLSLGEIRKGIELLRKNLPIVVPHSKFGFGSCRSTTQTAPSL